MRLASIVGARPQLIKAAVVSRALRAEHQEVLVHTGQHYDANLSDIFFEQLGIPAPDRHLGIGSGSHGQQTGRMLEALEAALVDARPDAVLVYGDTNSTLAGVLAAVKLHLPVAHVEAGLRSFNRRMPEEVNRVVADVLSRWLFCPTTTAVANLQREGIGRGVHLVGDVMYDLLRLVQDRLPDRDDLLRRYGVERAGYYLATIHRAENTDEPDRLRGILTGLTRLPHPVVFPLHPRTRGAIERAGLWPLLKGRGITVTEPVGYLQMVQLQRAAAGIVTDSGGVQKEAFLLGVPCVTVRDETEWIETLEGGWNVLVGADPERLVAAATRTRPVGTPPPVFGAGDAAQRMVATLAADPA